MCGCEGLDDEENFDGENENYPSFIKLISKRIEEGRGEECLNIATRWEGTGTTPKVSVADSFINTFESNTATKDQVDAHCETVWSDCAHAHTDKLPVRGVTKTGDKVAFMS